MNASILVRHASEAGIELRLADGKVKVRGRAAAVAALAPELREHRLELIEFLSAAHESTTALIEAAMRACDNFGDDVEARDQMKAECMSTPRHLWNDLIDHLEKTYPRRLP